MECTVKLNKANLKSYGFFFLEKIKYNSMTKKRRVKIKLSSEVRFSVSWGRGA